MNQHIIDVDQKGNVESLYNDKVRLEGLGKAKMTRASHIVFNDATQLWDVRVVGYEDKLMPPHYQGFHGYDEAIKFEVAILNAARRLDMLDKLDTLAGADLSYKVYRCLY